MSVDLEEISDEEKAVRRRWKFAQGKQGMWIFVDPVLYLDGPGGEPLPMFSIDATLQSITRGIGFFVLPMSKGGTMDLYAPLEMVSSYAPAPAPAVVATSPQKLSDAPLEGGKVLTFPKRPSPPSSPDPDPPPEPPSDPSPENAS